MEIDLSKLKKYKLEKTQLRWIYYLYDKWKLVYIGQSENIMRRIYSHTQDKEFDEFSFIQIEKPIDLLKIESEEINKYLPKYNKSLWWCNHKNKITYMFNLIRRMGYNIPNVNKTVLNMSNEELFLYIKEHTCLNDNTIYRLINSTLAEINKMRKYIWPKK